MAAIAYLVLFELSGVMLVWGLSRRKSPLIKIWLGLVVGLMELMWLPSLYAFKFAFTLKAHIFAAITAFVPGAALYIMKRLRRPTSAPTDCHTPPAWLLIALIIPLGLLSAYLHFSHTLREIDGALYSGQSTYGDLCMHAGFITGLVGQSYPPEYTLLPGTTLGYPFLVDALSSSLYLLGLDLSASIVIPGSLMTVLIYMGMMLFSYEVTRSKAACALSLMLVVFSGGLGFIYYLDLNGTLNLNTLQYGGEQYAAVENALTAYYNAPANFPQLNLRWVNALSDLIIPQRTLMAGWLVLLPALYMLWTGMENNSKRDFVLLGCFAGPMVMIHTHSFLGLGVISLGVLIDRLIRGRGQRGRILAAFGLYGGIAVLLALPQLMVWTFPQTFKGGSLKILFNWVNNNGNGTLKDDYLWFWIKNVGPMFIFIPIAAILSKNSRVKALALGSLMLFVLSEYVIFQPNVYDNNKLFWAAYLCMLPVGTWYLVSFIREHRHMLTKVVLSIMLISSMTLSGAVSVAREVISGVPGYAYQLFSPGHVEAAEYIKANTPQDALILTSNNHNNAAAALGGRRIVCGAGLYLYYHGVDYFEQERDAKMMLSDPENTLDLYAQYGIDYVYVSSYEANDGADWRVFETMFPLVFESSDEYWYDKVRIYAVSERAQVKFQQ